MGISNKNQPKSSKKGMSPFSGRSISLYEFKNYLRRPEVRQDILNKFRPYGVHSQIDVNTVIEELEKLFSEADLDKWGGVERWEMEKYSKSARITAVWENKREMKKLQQTPDSKYEKEKWTIKKHHATRDYFKSLFANDKSR